MYCEKYNYYAEVRADVVDHLDDDLWPEDGETKEDYASRLTDTLWNEDGVTGNQSGKYFYYEEEAIEAIMENRDLVKEAFEEFEVKHDAIWLLDHMQTADTIVRCYVLSTVCAQVAKDVFSGKLTKDEED